MLQITARRSDRPTSSIARQTVDRRAAVSNMSGDPEQEYFADGLAQEAEAHAQLALRLSPRGYGIGTAHLALAMALHAAQPCRSRALVRICNPGFASGTDPPCPDDRLQRPGR
jgi:hypothetical protein